MHAFIPWLVFRRITNTSFSKHMHTDIRLWYECYLLALNCRLQQMNIKMSRNGNLGKKWATSRKTCCILTVNGIFREIQCKLGLSILDNNNLFVADSKHIPPDQTALDLGILSMYMLLLSDNMGTTKAQTSQLDSMMPMHDTGRHHAFWRFPFDLNVCFMQTLQAPTSLWISTHIPTLVWIAK